MSGRGAARWLWVAIGLGLLVIPALPLPAWLHGPDVGPIWTPQVVSWGIGLLVIVTCGVLGGRLAVWVAARPRRVPTMGEWPLVIALAVAFSLAAATTMTLVFARNPHLVDEMAQLLHARAMASGRLAAPRPEPPAFFLITHTGLTPAGWTSQYPPGETVLLALGLLLHLEWLVNPVLGGVCVVLVFVLGRALYDRRTGLLGAALFAGSAWTLFSSATYMNHIAAGTYALAAWAAVWAPAKRQRGHWLLAGLLLAACAATRPLDAVAAAVPIGYEMLRSRDLRGVWWGTIGGAPVLAAWGYMNWRLYGHPWSMGYTALYGAEHGMGFHTDPWGLPYTPLTALSNMAVALRRLHIYANEWPIPALLPLAAWGVAGRADRDSDVVIGLGLLAVPLLYFFYWHSGFYLGPRLYYQMAPLIAVGTARAWWWAWDRVRRLARRQVRWDIALVTASVTVLVWGDLELVPARWRVYSEGLISLKYHPEVALAGAGVRRALVIIPESWGARIIANLWGMGAPPSLVEQIHRRLDACALSQFGARAHRKDLPAAEVRDSLEAMLRAAPPAPPLVPNWPDPTLRLSPRATLPPDCAKELHRDLEGFTLYGNHAWRNAVGLDRGIVFARDLYEYDPELFARYPGWAIWRLAPPEGRPNAPPVLTRVRSESEDAVPR